MPVPELIDYDAFYGDPYRMEVWKGDHVALLTPIEPVRADLDPAVMADLLAALDIGWAFYADLTGREPTPHDGYWIDGRGTIAVVETTCGAGCGYLGWTGIEFIYDFFGANLEGRFPWVPGVYDSMRDGQQIVSILFYEMGRNFWFYGGPLSAETTYWSFATAFAVYNRYLAGEATGLDWNPDDNEPGFHDQTMPDTARAHFSDPNATLETLYAAPFEADLAAAFLRIFHDHAGAARYKAFWPTVLDSPTAVEPPDVVANFLATATAITSQDWGFLFKDGWRVQVDGDRAGRLDAENVAEPAALLGFGGDDTLIGSRGVEFLLGGLGRDLLKGRAGDDDLAGGPGDDTLLGGDGADVLLGAAGGDLLRGGKGRDSLDGGAGEDTLRGGAGRDLLDGGAQSDLLDGGGGNDRLAGGKHDDTLTGGAGDDVFEFIRQNGDDLVTDFTPGQDRIDLRVFGLSPADFDALLDTALDPVSPGVARLDFAALGGSGAAVVVGLDPAAATLDDFIL